MHFEVYTKATTRADHLNSLTHPKTRPCFELVHNYDWEDFDFHDWFCLWYYRADGDPILLGDVKIMTEQELTTIEALGDGFDGNLDKTFCSLGLDLTYYRRIHENLLESEWRPLLKALRDCAVNQKIYDKFRDQTEFKHALMREMSSNDAFKYAKLILNGLKIEEAYAFEYTCEIPHSNSVALKADFQYECPIYKRAMGIIGENGMGKTRLLARFSESLSKREKDKFSNGKLPIFDACIVLSSTPFDCYEKVILSEQPQYLYLSLEQRDDAVVDNLAISIKDITNRRRMVRLKTLGSWYIETIRETIGYFIDDVVIRMNNEDGEVCFDVDKVQLDKAVHELSSGQLHLFSLLTYIFSNIHYSTLFIIDEPEVHLHPHTIVVFMRMLSQILGVFNSYAIIATHSPLVIRELVKSNVQVMKKVEDNHLELIPVAYNTFGEDITTLYYNIFDYDIKDSFFTSVIDGMINGNATYEKIVAQLEEDVPLSLNARMTIRDLIDEKKSRPHEEFEL